MTSTKFARISTDTECWGANVGFDCIAEARRIRDAAEAAGVEVAFDVDRRALRRYDDDGNERVEIEWFDHWCFGGYEWSDEQWRAWFEEQVSVA